MAKRGDVLELAILGLLHESPLHGYELRKRLNAKLGFFRALSYGTLYPALRQLVDAGLIHHTGGDDDETEPAEPLLPRNTRARIVYELTHSGKERFQLLVSTPGPSAVEDGVFDVHLAFFARTDAATRLRILEARRNRLQERLDGVRQAMSKTTERLDSYTTALQRHGEETAEREVRWLTELIDRERASNMTHLQESPDGPSSSESPHVARSPRKES